MYFVAEAMASCHGVILLTRLQQEHLFNMIQDAGSAGGDWRSGCVDGIELTEVGD